MAGAWLSGDSTSQCGQARGSSSETASRLSYVIDRQGKITLHPFIVLTSCPPSLSDLGFQSEAVASQFPIPNQIASQFLTLQGAIAHTDMPMASGPTMLLPYSQQFEYGYMAYRRPEFEQVFHQTFVQLELKRGDGLFFKPALFHAAGNNDTTGHQRTANLLQISAGWGKAMEHVDRSKLLLCTWVETLRLFEKEGGKIDSPRIQALVQAIADGYSFPTNLDKDPPPASGVSQAR